MEEEALRPEDNFDTWALIFLSGIEVGGEFRFLINGYVRLVDYWIENGTLPSELALETNNFLCDFIPRAVSKVLDLTFLSGDDQNVSMTFLKKTAELIPHAVVRENSALLKGTFEVLCTQKTFYMRNGMPYSSNDGKSSKCFQEVCRHVIETGGIEIMVQRCMTLPVPLCVFDGLLAVVWALVDGVEDFDFSLNSVESCMPILFDRLGQVERVDALMLQRIGSFATLLVEKCFPEFSEVLLSTAEKCTKSEVLDWQLVGADILCKLSKSPYNSVQEAFAQWTKETDLAAYVSSHDRNKVLLQRLEDVLPKLMNRKLIGEFWRAAEVEHVSVRGVMYAIISKALALLPEGDAIEFINEISESKNVDVEMLTFLAKTATTFASSNLQVANDLVKTVITLSLRENLRTEVDSVMDILIKSKPLQPVLYEVFGSHLSNVDEQAVVVQFLTKLVKESGEVRVGAIKKQYLSKISLQGVNRPLLMDLFVMMLVRTNQPLRLQFLQKFAEPECDDCLWSMLRQLFLKMGMVALDDESWKYLDEIVRQLQFFTVSSTFLDFFKDFIIACNVRADVVHRTTLPSLETMNKIPTAYVIDTVPIVHFDLAIKALLDMTNASTRKEWKKVLIHMLQCADYVSNKDLVEYLLSLLKSYIANGSREQKVAALDFLYTFITTVENGYVIEDFGRTRHYVVTKSQERNIVIDDLLTGLQFPMTTSLNISAKVLKTRVGLMIKRSPSTFYLKYQSFVLIHQNLTEVGLKNGSVVIVQMLSEAPKKRLPDFVMPSVVLDDLHFQDALLEMLHNTEDKTISESIWLLLKWLPTSNCISANEHDFEKPDESDLLHVYKLHIWLNQLRQMNNDDIEKHVPLLVELMISKRKGYAGIIRLFADRFVPRLTEMADQVIPFLMALFSTKSKFLPNCQTVIKKAIEADPARVSAVINDHMDLFETFICQLTAAEKTLSSIVSPLTNKSKLMLMCMKHIHEKQEKMHANIGRLFTCIAPDIVSDSEVEEILTQCLDLLMTTKASLFKNVASVVKAIFEAKPDLAKKHADLVVKFLPILLELDESRLAERSAGMEICSFILQTAGLTEEVRKLLEPYVSLKTDSYNYRPTNNQRAKSGYAGLRNLGATCYMNSILQQLYHTMPFRYLILTSKLHEQSQLALQYLFAEMTLSQRKSCDTEPFCKIWKGWGGQVINPREQQDAFEFLQFFLDQYDERFRRLFQGEIRNTIEAIGTDFSSYNTEKFYGLPVDVLGYKTLSESLKVFLQSEMFTGNNQYKMDNGQFVDAKKYARVAIAPDVLVFQLKRFEYDHTTWERYKLNDRFEFPKTLNIRELMCDDSEDRWYNLVGVVLHAGTAQGGHYTSLIRLNKKWMWFNDGEVTEVPEKSFEAKTFGDKSKHNDFDSKECAYMLFYVKSDASFEIDGKQWPVEKQLKMDAYIDPQTRTEIERDSEEFVRKQVAFSTSIYDMMMAVDDPILLLKYFLNVFCHSAVSKGTGQMETKLITVLSASNLVTQEFEIINSQREDIRDIFIHCSQADVVDTLILVVTSILAKVPVEDSGSFASYFLDALVELFRNWRQVPCFLKLLNSFVAISDEQRKYVIEKGWKNAFLGLLDLIYEAKSSVMTKNIDLTFMFTTLSLISDTMGPSDIELLMSFASMIVQSSVQIREFLALINKLSSTGHVDLVGFITALIRNTKDGVNESMLTELLMQAVCCPMSDEQVNQLMTALLSNTLLVCNDLVGSMATAIKTGNETIRNFYLEHAQVTLFAMLTNPAESVQRLGETLIKAVFNSVEPIDLLKDGDKYSSYGPENIFAEEYSGLTDKSRAEMQQLLDKMITFIKTNVIPHPESFCHMALVAVVSIMPGLFSLNSFLKVFLWFLSSLDQFTEDTFKVLFELFNACAGLQHPIDYNMTMCALVMSHFPRDLISPVALDVFQKVFQNVPVLATHQVFMAFEKVWPIVVAAGDEAINATLHMDGASVILYGVLGCPWATSEMKAALAKLLCSLVEKEPDAIKIVLNMFQIDPWVCWSTSSEFLWPLLEPILSHTTVDMMRILIDGLLKEVVADVKYQRFPESLRRLTDSMKLAEFLMDHSEQAHLNELNPMDFQKIQSLVEGLGYAEDGPFGTSYRKWMHFWATASAQYHDEIYKQFNMLWRAAKNTDARRIATAWATFIVEENPETIDTTRLYQLFTLVHGGSQDATRHLYHYLATLISGPRESQIRELARLITTDYLAAESIETKSVAKVFTAGVKDFEPDMLIALVLGIVDDMEDLLSAPARAAVRKLCIVALARPEMKESLVGFLPFGGKQDLIDADMMNEAEIIFGTQTESPCIYTDATEDENVEQDEAQFDCDLSPDVTCYVTYHL